MPDEESGYDPPKKPHRVERPYAADGHALTKRQISVLDLLRRRPERSLSQIARICGASQRSVSNTIDRLFMLGYVEVIPGRAQRKYRASSKGRALCRWIRAVEWHKRINKWNARQRRIRRKQREKKLRERARWFYYYANLDYPLIDIIEMQFDQNWRWPRVWSAGTARKIVCKYAQANNLPIPERILYRLLIKRKESPRGNFGRKDS